MAEQFLWAARLDFVQKYPNYFNESLSHFALCSKANIPEIALQAFERCCPHILRVQRVKLERSTQAPVCRWLVEYHLQNGDDPRVQPLPDGAELRAILGALRRFRPLDLCVVYEAVYGKQRDISDTILIQYGCLCDCAPPFELATNQESPHLWFENRTLLGSFGSLSINDQR